MNVWIGVAVWAVVLTMWGFMIVYSIGAVNHPFRHCHSQGYDDAELSACYAEEMEKGRQ